MDMKKILEVATEVAEKAHAQVKTIVFTDSTIAQITGSWQANKPVWVCFENYKPTFEEVGAALVQAYEGPTGEPAYPKGYLTWRKENPELAQKIEKYGY